MANNELNKCSNKVRDIIGKHFNYSFDFDFLDVVALVVNRIDTNEYKSTEDKRDFIEREITESVIYTNDEWLVLMHYTKPYEANYEYSFDKFADDIEAICDEITRGNE